MQRVYFPGLNAIRAWAAIFVVWYHIEQVKSYFNIIENRTQNYFFIARYTMQGIDAVLLFFVLSGFLITYLLLLEIQNTAKVDIQKFYIRRSLRIWPLYYFVMFLGFFLVPLVIMLSNFQGFYPPISENFFPKFFLYFFFLPNVAQLFGFFPIGISHLWSIGVEEVFYLIWPQLIQRFRRGIIPAILLILFVRPLLIILLLITLVFAPNFYPETNVFLTKALLLFPFEGMGIGALGAYAFYHHKARVIAVVSQPWVTWIIFILFALNVTLLKSETLNPVFGPLTTSILCSIYIALILRIAYQPKFGLNFDTPSYKFLGKLSYGIYIYHFIVIYFVMIAFDKIGWRDNGIIYNLSLYAIVTFLTIVVAHFSYEWFESRFLKLKQGFQTIESGAA